MHPEMNGTTLTKKSASPKIAVAGSLLRMNPITCRWMAWCGFLPSNPQGDAGESVLGIGWRLLNSLNGFRRRGGTALDLYFDPVPKGARGQMGDHCSSGGSDGFEQIYRLIEQM